MRSARLISSLLQWNIQRKATSKIFSAANFRGCITNCIDADIAKLRTIVENHADAGKGEFRSVSLRCFVLADLAVLEQPLISAFAFFLSILLQS